MAQIPMEMTPAANLFGQNNAPIWHGIEAAGQTYKRGAPLINSSGSLATAADEPSAGTVIGIANAAATGTTGSDVPFTPVFNGIIFECTADVASGTSVTGTGTIAQADIWNYFDLSLDTTSGFWYLDQAETTEGGLLLIGVKQGVVLGTTKQPRVYVVFSNAKLVASAISLSAW